LLFLHLSGHFIYLCKIWQSYLFLYPLLDIKWSYLYTANRYNVVSLLSFNKRNHTMLLQNFNGVNFFSCKFVNFHRKGWCLINVICVCLRIMVPNTYCVVHMFFFCLWLAYNIVPVSLDFPFWLSLRYSLTFIISTLDQQPGSHKR
jgi:hypothetical protein